MIQNLDYNVRNNQILVHHNTKPHNSSDYDTVVGYSMNRDFEGLQRLNVGFIKCKIILMTGENDPSVQNSISFQILLATCNGL